MFNKPIGLVLVLMTCIFFGEAKLLVAETGLLVDRNGQTQRYQGGEHSRWLKDLNVLDRQAERSLRAAYLKIFTARSANERDFFRLDYVEQRVFYLHATAQHVIRLIDGQRQLALNMRQAEQAYTQLLESEVLPGLHNLMSMVIVSSTGQSQAQDHADLEALYARRHLQEMVLNNLAMQPPLMGAFYKSRNRNMFKQLYQGLEDLRHEVDTLRNQMGRI